MRSPRSASLRVIVLLIIRWQAFCLAADSRDGVDHLVGDSHRVGSGLPAGRIVGNAGGPAQERGIHHAVTNTVAALVDVGHRIVAQPLSEL